MTARAQEQNLDSLVLDLLEWVAAEPRTYAQTMEVWRTSCPRLAVWEEAVDRGLVTRVPGSARSVRIVLTSAGRTFVQRRRLAAENLTDS